MLRTSRIDPSKSAYEVLEGPHDFNRHPWAPLGCRAVIHKPAVNRTSWGPRATDAWYIGPAPDHHRCYEFYVPATRAYCISTSAQFFPTYCEIPHEPPTEAATRTAAELIIELKQQRNLDPSSLSRQQRAIKIITDIYNINNQTPPSVGEDEIRPPRVDPTLSSNPTAPKTIQQTQ